MTTFLLIPGGGSDPSYWRFVVNDFAQRGHLGVAIDLPCEDDHASLEQYVASVVHQCPDGAGRPVVVAHSFGAFTGALACAPLDARELVYVSAMVPRVGERPDQWWSVTGCERAQRRAAVNGGYDASDMTALFYNGVDAHVVAAEIERRQSDTPSQATWPGKSPQPISTRFILLRDDRFFPADFMRTVVADRLTGVTPEVAPGGHMAMLSHPTQLVDAILGSSRL